MGGRARVRITLAFLWCIIAGMAASSFLLLRAAATHWDSGVVSVAPSGVKTLSYPTVFRQLFSDSVRFTRGIPGLAFIRPPLELAPTLNFFRVFGGSYHFPAKLYKDVSQSFTIDFYQQAPVAAAGEQTPQSEAAGGRLRISGIPAREYVSLQIVLSGAGVEPDRAIQVQPLSANVLSYKWYCRFKDTGSYTATATFSGVRPDGRIVEFGHFDQQLRVVRVDDMDDGQVWNAGIAVGSIGFVSTILGVLKTWKDLKNGKTPRHKHAHHP